MTTVSAEWTTEHYHAEPQVSALVTDSAVGDIQAGNLVHKCVNGRAPEYLAEFCHPSVDRRPGMRSADSQKLHVPCTLTSFDVLFAAVLVTFNRRSGLPPVPFSPGRPVFQPVCPASRCNVCRDAICPVFCASCAA